MRPENKKQGARLISCDQITALALSIIHSNDIQALAESHRLDFKDK
jgi:hypothetical protein